MFRHSTRTARAARRGAPDTRPALNRIVPVPQHNAQAIFGKSNNINALTPCPHVGTSPCPAYSHRNRRTAPTSNTQPSTPCPCAASVAGPANPSRRSTVSAPGGQPITICTGRPSKMIW